MKRFLIPVFIALIVSSCATVEGYKKTLQTWIGSPEGALIQSWGPPSSVYVSGGSKYLTYNKSRSGYVPGTSPKYTTTLIRNTAYTTSSGGSPGFAYMKL
jgi:hypothetical protein